MDINSKNKTIKKATMAVWGATPAGWTYGNNYPKGSKEFFESVLAKRFSYECDWLDEIVDFKRFKGKKVLEIGCGAGYDAYQFCKHGAHYTGIDITPDNPIITKKHLSYYGYEPKTIEMDAEALSFNETFDYVYSFGVLHHTPNIKEALKRINTVVRPGGEIQIIVYNKYSIFYILNIVLFEWILTLQFLKMSLKKRRSKIESTTSNEEPLVNVYSKKEIQHLINQAGFSILKTDIRKLVREDLPGIPFIMKLYNYIPDSWLKKLGKRYGWYISVRAIKL